MNIAEAEMPLRAAISPHVGITLEASFLEITPGVTNVVSGAKPR